MAVVVFALSFTALGLGVSNPPSALAVALTANWIQLSPPTSPPARTAASMAYDPATGDMVLFGGVQVTNGNLTILADTWTWDGSTWTQQFPETIPPARYGASLAYDAKSGDLVLFGGLSSSGDLADTWTWDGSTWTQQSPKTSPPARSTASMAYDAASGNVVLFGGLDDRTLLDDTWTWDGSTWTQQSPGTKPSARDAASMAYDPATQQTVLFGGNAGSASMSDTWTWDGSTWTDRSSPSSPSARYASSMAYDPATSSLILFGGYGGGQGDLSDMWTWSGSWTEQYPATSPSARRYASMDYDPSTGAVVLFGGDPGGVTPSSLADTWIWGSEGTFTDVPAFSSIVVGSSDLATAAVTGNAGAESPTGTVTFSTCEQTPSGGPCASQAAALGSPVPLTASGADSATATSPSFTPPSAGTWCFLATYSGDSDYTQVTDDTDGCFVVDPPIATTPALPTIVLDGSNSDGATVFGTTAFGDPTGTVTFYACGPTATPTPCTSEADQLGPPVPLTPGTDDTAIASSPVFTPASVGYWCFAGDYSGDGNYAPSSDSTIDECFSVSPDFTTSPTTTSIGLDDSNTDTGTVTGNAEAGPPTGTVTFYACGPTATPTPCTSEADQLGPPVPLTPGTDDTAIASSPVFTPASVGYWCFAGDYSGDGTYAPSSDSSTNECFNVVPVLPALTSPDSASAIAKEPFTFTVTTTGAPTPAISGTGLAHWLVLTDNGDGTATISATKARQGRHRFALTATNSAGSVTQTFTLTVKKAASE